MCFSPYLYQVWSIRSVFKYCMIDFFCLIAGRKVKFLKKHVSNWDKMQKPWSVNTEPFYLSLSVFPRSRLAWARPWEGGQVWTTPDMTGCLTISIRANEHWEKADRLTLQIGASGVKLQESVNYLNWSGDGFLDNQFDQADDRVTRITLQENRAGLLKKLGRHTKMLFPFVKVILFRHVRWWVGAADTACKQWHFSWFN